ncbi:MAG: ATPase, T2SS/T4P/T4SS family [Candidatus Diapherotrites archaeon]
MGDPLAELMNKLKKEKGFAVKEEPKAGPKKEEKKGAEGKERIRKQLEMDLKKLKESEKKGAEQKPQKKEGNEKPFKEPVWEKTETRKDAEEPPIKELLAEKFAEKKEEPKEDLGFRVFERKDFKQNAGAKEKAKEPFFANDVGAGELIPPEPKELAARLVEAGAIPKEPVVAVPEKSEAEVELDKSKKTEIESYGDTKIYSLPGKPMLYYFTPVPRPTAAEKGIINTIKEAATRIISIAPYKIRDPEQRRNTYYQKVMEILQATPELNIPQRRYQFYADAVIREMVGYGMIDSLIKDDRLEEIMIIGPTAPVYVFHRQHEMMVTNIEFYSDSEIQDLINKVARQVGRRVDISSPLLDARLPDGSRVNATIPPASVIGSTLTIRKFRKDPYSIIDLIKLNTVDADVAAFMWLCADGIGVNPANILIAGGTGSGKTTTLNILASFIPERERIISIEDSVDGDEEVFVFNKNKPKKIKIKELVDKKIIENGCSYSGGGHEISQNFEDLETICFDESGKIKRAVIGSFIRHKTNKKMYEIIFRSGRKIKVTEDHSLFTINGEAKICPVKTGELKAGHFLAVPRKLSFDCEGVKEMNLVGHLDRLKGLFVVGEPISNGLRKINRSLLEKYCGGKTAQGRKCSANYWKRKGLLPAAVLDSLRRKGLIDLSENSGIFFKTKVNSKKIPATVKLDKAFLEFIGFWIADGCYDKNSVILSTQDKEVIPLIKEVAERFNANVTMHSDEFSWMVNSSILKKVMVHALGLYGNAYTKKIPDWANELSDRQVCWLLRGYFSGDGTSGKHEIEWTSCSEQLMKDIQTMLLRNGITARIATKRFRKDKSFKGRISSRPNVPEFMEKIAFLQDEKNEKAMKILLNGEATHDITDLIPLPASFLKRQRHELKLQHEYYSGRSMLGRRFLNKVVSFTENNELELLANSDIFWDEIKKIKRVPQKERFVYDFSVPGYENFVCSNVFVHNTAELNLPLKHWIRLEARPPGLEGSGEITLDILTKNSLRMRPDRIIVGEVRHDEAFTLFTAMNTGHKGSMGTVHSNSAQETVVRITSPPMSVPVIMMSGLDIVLVQNRIHDKKKGTIRRVTEIAEVTGALEGHASAQTIYNWDPVTDTLKQTNVQSNYLKEIERFTGMNRKQIATELSERAKFLKKLLDKNIRRIDLVSAECHKFLLERKG